MASYSSHTQYDGGQNEATSLLVHYFRTLFNAQGLQWNDDNTAEISQLVECIISVAQAQQE